MRVFLVLAAAVALLAVPTVPARHLEDGSYRCDGGWCRDGGHRELDCSGGGCVGETGGFTTILDPPRGDGSWLVDDDWVLGVVVDGEAVAYPIRVISGQQGWEIVVDTVGGTRVMATYCPLCASGIAYETAVDGDGITFRNSGAIWKRDMVMYDKATGSLWSQVAGEAIHGPHEGDALTVVTSSMVRWSAWTDTHPDTRAMERPRRPDGRDICSCPPFTDLDPARLLHGIAIDGQVLAFPHDTLRDEGVARVDLAGRSLVATYRGDAVHVFDVGDREIVRAGNGTWLVDGEDRRYHPVTGEALDGGENLTLIPGKTTLSERWELFHPDSRYYQGGGEVGEAPPDRGTLPGFGVVTVAGAGLAGAWWSRRAARRREP